MNRVIGLPTEHFNTNETVNFANKTGAALTTGAVGFIDSPQADADSTSVSAGLDDIVAVTTARYAQASLLAVAASEANGAADNGRAPFYVGEGLKCRIAVNSTADIAKGDKLKPVNAQTYLVKATAPGAAIDPTSTTALDRWYAEALEARASDDTGLIDCILYSRGRF